MGTSPYYEAHMREREISAALLRRVRGFFTSNPHAVQASKQERERETESTIALAKERETERAEELVGNPRRTSFGKGCQNSHVASHV